MLNTQPYDSFGRAMAKRAGKNLEAYAKLSEDQLASISMYTSDYYEPINSLLRGKPLEGTPEENKFYSDRARDITTALMQVPNAKEQTYYRAFSGDLKESRTQQFFASLQPGDQVSDDAFSSFSTNHEEAKKFLDPELSGNTMLILNSSRLKQIDFLSQSPQEEEHLAMPGEKFRVKSTRVYPDRDTGANIRVIELEDYDKDPF